MGSAKRSNESAHAAFLLLHNVMGLLSRLEERTYSRDAGVSYQQFLILVTIASADPPVTQTTIANRLQRNLNSISMMVDRMERLGLVRRERSTIDRRETHVSVTSEGKARLEGALEVGRGLRDRLGGIFSETDMQDAMRLMTKLRNQVMMELGKEPMEPGTEREIRQKITELFEGRPVKSRA